jgi:hypothetical protein
MSVHVVADTVSKLSDLRATLERRYAVTSELLSGAGNEGEDTEAVVVTADLRRRLPELPKSWPRSNDPAALILRNLSQS